MSVLAGDSAHHRVFNDERIPLANLNTRVDVHTWVSAANDVFRRRNVKKGAQREPYKKAQVPFALAVLLPGVLSGLVMQE